VDDSVEPPIEQRQEDVQTPLRLPNQFRPDVEFEGLAGG